MTRAQHRALKKAASRKGISMTEMLRRIIDRHLKGRRGVASFEKEAILSFIGLGSSGHRNISKRHDQALDKAFRDGSLH